MKPNFISEEQFKEMRERMKKSSDGLRQVAASALGQSPAQPKKNAQYAPYKNKLEHSFALTLVMAKHAGEIKAWGYECLTLKLSAGKHHRPDFLIWHHDGTIEIAQTKGYHKNMRASITGLKWAAQLNPWYKFTVHRYKNGWHSEEVTI